MHACKDHFSQVEVTLNLLRVNITSLDPRSFSYCKNNKLL